MAINRNVKVPMPDSKVTFKLNSNGDTYVSYNVATKRINANYVKHTRKIIGIKDPSTGMLIPNATYYDLFKEDVISNYTPKRIRNYGNYYLLYRIASEVNLINILKDVFPTNWNKILTCAMYVACEGNVMDYCEDWCEETYTIENTFLSSPAISNLIRAISIDERLTFFKKWTKIIKEHEIIAFDSTSISTYAKDITQAEYGHNKDKDSLAQINFGMFYGQNSHLPLFYDIYNGSLLDKEHFESMMRYVKTFNISRVIFVMDRGYFKKDNLKYLFNNYQPFIIGLSLSLKDVKIALKPIKQIIKNSINVLTHQGIYGKSIETTVLEIPIRLNLYFSYQKQADEIAIIDKEVAKLEEELKGKQTIIDEERYKKYFDITINDDKTFSYIKKYDSIDEEKENAGFFALATSRLDYSVDEILTLFRNKDYIEKSFDDLKNYLDSDRLRVHTDEALNGKIFITFIALILKSQINKIMIEEIKQNKTNTKKILLELKKIKVTTLHNEDTILLPLTKTQKDILKRFNISSEEIKKSVLQMHL